MIGGGYSLAMLNPRAAAIALLLLAAACGGDGDNGGGTAGGDPTTTIGTTGTTASGGGSDECRFVATSAVQDAFGDAMELRTADQGCTFSDGDVTLQFSHVDVQIDPEEYYDGAIESSCDEGTVVEVDAGDRAFACVSFVGPLANVYEGRDLAVINTSGVEDDAAESVRDQLADLLPEMSAG